MPKPLSEMSLEELWKLFPINLTKHQPIWETWYQLEKGNLAGILPAKYVKRISHIGSTAIPEIWAKPIVDILIEVSQDSPTEKIKKIMLQNGYLLMSQDQNRMAFNKGYTEYGFAEKVYHIHIRVLGDNDELYFRDYLINQPVVAKEYEAMKLKLWKEYEFNRDGYTNAKTEFIKKYTWIAKMTYMDRY